MYTHTHQLLAQRHGHVSNSGARRNRMEYYIIIVIVVFSCVTRTRFNRPLALLIITETFSLSKKKPFSFRRQHDLHNTNVRAQRTR